MEEIERGASFLSGVSLIREEDPKKTGGRRGDRTRRRNEKEEVCSVKEETAVRQEEAASKKEEGKSRFEELPRETVRSVSFKGMFFWGLLFLGAATIIVPRITGRPLFPIFVLKDLKSLSLPLLPLLYTGSYVTRAWGPLTFAFCLGGGIIAFVSQERCSRLLASGKGSAYVAAALTAPILTVCSCAMLPIFGALLIAGAGIGPAVTFLLMAPAANVMALFFTWELLSWKLAVGRFLASALGAMAIGCVVSRTSFGKVKEQEYAGRKRLFAGTTEEESFWEKSGRGLDEALGLAKKILPVLLLGVAAISFVEAYLPPPLVAKYLTGFRGVVIGSFIGVPTYTPTLVEVFLVKAMLGLGMDPAAALAFMIGGPMSSIPSMMSASRIAGWKVVGTYAALAVLLGIVAGGVFLWAGISL